MDCEKLNQDIAELQTLRDRFAQKIDELNDTMRGKIEARKIQEEIRGLEDQILESYAAAFKEKNPELSRWCLGEEIDGLEGARDYNQFISSIVQLPNGEGMLVGGRKGALYECQKDRTGKWRLRLGEKIDGIYDAIHSIAQLPDGEGMLVGGDTGTLRVCRKDKDGKWKPGEKIYGFEGTIYSIAQLPDGEGMLVGGSRGRIIVCRKDKDGKWKPGEKIDGIYDAIHSIAQLPDGEGMLVGGEFGALCVCRKDEDGIWRLGEEIGGFKDAWGDECDIETIAPLPDGEGMLVGGGRGELRVCRKNEDGKWRLEEEINGFMDTWDYACDIETIAPLPDGEGMLVGGGNGALYVCRKNEDGKWKLEERIDGFDTAISSIASLPDGGMLVGGDKGSLFKVCRSDLSVDTIKQNLDIIIRKGAV